MNSNQKHHEEIVYGLYRQLEIIFDSSEGSVYLYLDESHKLCNSRFASLLGYTSPDEWMRNENFMETVADLRSRRKLTSAYQDVIMRKIASTINVKWKRKSGDTIDTTVIVVPISFENHLLALNFISRKK